MTVERERGEKGIETRKRKIYYGVNQRVQFAKKNFAYLLYSNSVGTTSYPLYGHLMDSLIIAVEVKQLLLYCIFGSSGDKTNASRCLMLMSKMLVELMHTCLFYIFTHTHTSHRSGIALAMHQILVYPPTGR